MAARRLVVVMLLLLAISTLVTALFPRPDDDKVSRVRGMNVTIVIKNARSADESRSLLTKVGMPFRRRN